MIAKTGILSITCLFYYNTLRFLVHGGANLMLSAQGLLLKEELWKIIGASNRQVLIILYIFSFKQ